MRRRTRAGAWRLHQAGSATAVEASSDLSPALHGIGENADGSRVAQTIRAELVDGLLHEAMLVRIRAHFAATLQADHVRYTRRAWLELQGRRHAPRHAGMPPAN